MPEHEMKAHSMTFYIVIHAKIDCVQSSYIAIRSTDYTVKILHGIEITNLFKAQGETSFI